MMEEKEKDEEKVKVKKSRKRKADEDLKVDVGHGFVTSNPLPDVFPGVKVVMMEGLRRRDTLERFFVAFGGKLLPASQISEATHVIYPEGGRIKVEGKTKT